MRLLLLHPNLPSCPECQTWMYDAETGKKKLKGGLPVRRPKGTPLPCHACPKIPDGDYPHPANAVELSEENYLAFAHYRRCRAVNRFPEDPVVGRNAAVIRLVEDAVESGERYRLFRMVSDALVVARVLKR